MSNPPAIVLNDMLSKGNTDAWITKYPYRSIFPDGLSPFGLNPNILVHFGHLV